MGAAPAPPAAALQRGVRAAVAATPRAGVARRGGGGARGRRGLGVLALCAASELLHEHPPLTHHWSTPWLFALSSNASLVLLRVFSLVIDWGYLITQFVVG